MANLVKGMSFSYQLTITHWHFITYLLVMRQHMSLQQLINVVPNLLKYFFMWIKVS